MSLDLSGRQVAHYRVIERIGAGGMGVVYRAEDVRLDRPVALKFLSPRLEVSDADDRLDRETRFQLEAKAASAVEHVNVCTVYDVGETEDGLLYIAMALLDGRTLEQVLRSGRLEAERATDVVRQVARGLLRAHERGIVHRDLKPGNVFLTNDGVVKILDFGLAKLASTSSKTQPDLRLGTPRYMAPEQITSTEVDHRVDLWALGVMLYEMLAGRPPFSGPNHSAVLYNILHATPEPLAKLRTDLPPALEKVAERLMQRQPGARYQSAADVLLDLGESLAPTTSVSSTIIGDGQGSVAVLPFADLSPQKDQQYFCDGLADELIDSLTRIPGLRVLARTSTQRFRARDDDPMTIGRVLGVGTLVDGSLRKAGNRVRVTAQLLDTVSGTCLWSERFDRQLEDIFEIQDEITAGLVQRIATELTPGSAPTLIRRPEARVDAYDLYFQARRASEERSGAGLRRAIELFEDALKVDSRYTPAMAGMAQALALLGIYGHERPAEVMPRAKDLAEHALRETPGLAEAEVALGYIASAYDWDFAAGEEHFQAAINRRPDLSLAYIGCAAQVFVPQHRTDQAAELLARAQRYDPLSAVVRLAQGLPPFYRGDYSGAARHFEETAASSSDFAPAFYFLGQCYQELQRHREAIDALQTALRLAESSAENRAALACALADAGDSEGANRQLEALRAAAGEHYVPPLALAQVLYRLGQRELGLEQLALAFEERDPNVLWLPVRPNLRALKESAPCAALLRQAGLGG